MKNWYANIFNKWEAKQRQKLGDEVFLKKHVPFHESYMRILKEAFVFLLPIMVCMFLYAARMSYNIFKPNLVFPIIFLTMFGLIVLLFTIFIPFAVFVTIPFLKEKMKAWKSEQGENINFAIKRKGAQVWFTAWLLLSIGIACLAIYSFIVNDWFLINICFHYIVLTLIVYMYYVALRLKENKHTKSFLLVILIALTASLGFITVTIFWISQIQVGMNIGAWICRVSIFALLLFNAVSKSSRLYKCSDAPDQENCSQ